jgi:type II secretory pathway predicted ATPase ExeA
MYKEYYGFTHLPFQKDIPTDELMVHKNLQEYQKRIKFLLKHYGIWVICGTPGSGKSVGLRWLRDSLSRNRYRFYYLPDPPSSPTDLYRQMILVMDLEPAFRRIDMLHRIQEHILNLSVDKKITPVIALDECQMYSHSVLESVRLFLNFDVDSRHHLILLLSGQTEFHKRLRYAVYEPLTQRITIQHQFEGLNQEESETYLHHRLSQAGVKHQLFEPEAIQFIYQVTKGTMRKIDILAIQSLLLAAGKKQKTVNQGTVEIAVKENLWS